ncbi:MAG: LysR family transcriptional regulator [Pseudomonadota bacterium]
MLTGDGLQAFLAIADCGNLTAAASQLSKTQSALSVQLRKVESALNTRLFTRSPQGMRLTPEGLTLLPHARQVVSSLRDAQAVFEDRLQGTVRVGLPDDCAGPLLEHALRRFRESHPGVEVEAFAGCTSGFAGQIARGELDVAVHSGPEALSAHVHSVESTVWAANPGFSLPADAPVPLAQLDRACWWRQMTESALARAARRFHTRFLSNDFTSLRSALRAGLAVGALPASSLDSSLRTLGPQDGLPALPMAVRSILTNTRANPNLTAAMRDALMATRPATPTDRDAGVCRR